jgi:hypothetical protein
MATGVTDIFCVLLSVDVVLGPCITLIIFDVRKKELARDLAIVLAVQLTALAYGMHSVFIARPVYVVFNVDRFDLVYGNDLSDDKLNKVSNPEFRSTPLLRPKIVAARRPVDSRVRNEIMFGAISGGDDLPQLPQYYVSYSEEQAQSVKRIKSLDDLRLFNKSENTGINALSLKYRNVEGGIGYLPLRARVRDLVVIVARRSGDVLEIATFNPW